MSDERNIETWLRHAAGHLINEAISDGEIEVAKLCEAADEIDRLRDLVAKREDLCGDLTKQLVKAKALMQECVDTYYVASGKIVIDGQDGYSPLRDLRLFLSDENGK